jgi:hypothetical protein
MSTLNDERPIFSISSVIDAELLGVPVLDQPVEHVEVVRKINDSGGVAVGEADLHGAREGALRRNELALLHARSRLSAANCAGNEPSTAAPAASGIAPSVLATPKPLDFLTNRSRARRGI